MTYSIKPLKYATQRVPGPQAFLQSSWSDTVDFDFFVFLIQGEGMTAVVDCGMDDPSGINSLLLAGLGPQYLIRARPDRADVAALLAEEGVRLEDVDYVALTHFHSDHVSNVALFPRARYLISSGGWAELERLRSEIPQMIADPVFPAASIDYIEEMLEERVDLVDDGPTPLPGVGIRHIGGHTADSAAFTVPTAEGTVLIPGDTIYTYANLETDTPVGSLVDVAACYRAMKWAREVADLVLPTHDPLIIARHPGGVRG